jgi:hypothetical protein
VLEATDPGDESGWVVVGVGVGAVEEGLHPTAS